MALSIKDEATDRVVRRYAALRGTNYTQAIKLAVTEALEREDPTLDEETARAARASEFMDRVREVQRLVADAPIVDPRPYREILYDEDGLPR